MGGGSWSINLEDIPQGVKAIEYITPQSRYLIDAELAFHKGFMQILGGERKLVVPLKYWIVNGENK